MNNFLTRPFRKKLTLFDIFLGTFCFFPFSFKFARGIQVILTYGIATLYLILNLKYLLCLFKDSILRASLVTKLLVIAVILFAPIVTNSEDFSYIVNYAGYLRGFILILVYGIHLRRKFPEYTAYDFMFCFVKSINLYVLTSLILMIPVLRMLYTNIIYMNERNTEIVEGVVYYTRFGLQGFSGFGHTIMCSLAVVCFWILKLNNQKISYIYFILSIVGCACYGRAGLMVSIAVSIYFAVCAIKYKNIKYIVAIICSSVICLVAILIYIEHFSNQYNAFSWMLEPFVNIIEGNNLSASTDDLKTMYRLDFTPLQLLLGHGKYSEGNGRYYMNTDVGFLRLLYYGGLFFLLAYYISDILLFIGVSYNVMHCSGSFFIFVCVMMVFALYEAKGESCYLLYKVLFTFALFQNRSVKKEMCNGSIVYNKSI